MPPHSPSPGEFTDDRPNPLVNLRAKGLRYEWIDKGPQWFRQVGESLSVMQVESESPLVNPRLKKNVTANNIVSFKRVAVAA